MESFLLRPLEGQRHPAGRRAREATPQEPDCSLLSRVLVAAVRIQAELAVLAGLLGLEHMGAAVGVVVLVRSRRGQGALDALDILLR